MPADNFTNKVIELNLEKSINEKSFESPYLYIDIDYFNTNKEYDKLAYDIVLEATSIQKIEKNNIINFEVSKLATAFKIISTEINNENKEIKHNKLNIKHKSINDYKIKIESQKSLIKGSWYEMHDVYGMNSDYNNG